MEQTTRQAVEGKPLGEVDPEASVEFSERVDLVFVDALDRDLQSRALARRLAPERRGLAEVPREAGRHAAVGRRRRDGGPVARDVDGRVGVGDPPGRVVQRLDEVAGRVGHAEELAPFPVEGDDTRNLVDVAAEAAPDGAGVAAVDDEAEAKPLAPARRQLLPHPAQAKLRPGARREAEVVHPHRRVAPAGALRPVGDVAEAVAGGGVHPQVGVSLRGLLDFAQLPREQLAHLAVEDAEVARNLPRGVRDVGDADLDVQPAAGLRDREALVDAEPRRFVSGEVDRPRPPEHAPDRAGGDPLPDAVDHGRGLRLQREIEEETPLLPLHHLKQPAGLVRHRRVGRVGDGPDPPSPRRRQFPAKKAVLQVGLAPRPPRPGLARGRRRTRILLRRRDRQRPPLPWRDGHAEQQPVRASVAVQIVELSGDGLSAVRQPKAEAPQPRRKVGERDGHRSSGKLPPARVDDMELVAVASRTDQKA